MDRVNEIELSVDAKQPAWTVSQFGNRNADHGGQSHS